MLAMCKACTLAYDGECGAGELTTCQAPILKRTTESVGHVHVTQVWNGERGRVRLPSSRHVRRRATESVGGSACKNQRCVAR